MTRESLISQAAKKPGFWENVGMEPEMAGKKPGFCSPRDRATLKPPKKPGFWGNVGMEPEMAGKKPGFCSPRDRAVPNQSRNRVSGKMLVLNQR